MAGRPVDDETREEIRCAARSGLSRNQVAKQFKVAGDTVSRICAEAGISFDRSQTELAVRARTVDLADARQVLVASMMLEAQAELESLNAPYLVFNIGGGENKYTEQLLDSAPMDVRRNAMTNAGIAFDKATKVLEKTSSGVESAHSLLDSLAAGFAAAAAGYETPNDAE